MKASIDELKLFLRIVELGSLRQAAIEYRAEPSTVSRRLGALESRLGVKLIERSKVNSYPTQAGKSYYQRLRTLLQQLDLLEEEVSGQSSHPSGLLRVNCPVDFGAQYITPWLHELQLSNPGLEIELMLSDQLVSLVEEGVDVAIRIGELSDSSLRARRLGDMQMMLVASQGYIAQHGMPKSPEELDAHKFVLYQWLKSPSILTLSKKGAETKVRMRSRFAVNNVGAIINAVSSGAGIHYAPKWIVYGKLDSLGLVEVLPDWDKTSYPVHALYLASEIGFIPAKTRALVDLLVQKMRTIVI